MKSITMIMMLFVISMNAKADIKNGFEKELIKAKQAKESVRILLDRYDDNDMALAKLNTQYILIKIELDRLRKSFNWTEELIKNLQIAHPALYDEINSIKDYHGNKTDVYIRALPKDQMREIHWGKTNLRHADGDDHTYESMYGPQTVSVIVRQCTKTKSLRLFVHELGHVKYQVPNLASYLIYFQEEYKYARQNDAFGHKLHDPSNQSVITELKRFTEVVNKRKQLIKNTRNESNSLLADQVALESAKDNNEKLN